MSSYERDLSEVLDRLTALSERIVRDGYPQIGHGIECYRLGLSGFIAPLSHIGEQEAATEPEGGVYYGHGDAPERSEASDGRGEGMSSQG